MPLHKITKKSVKGCLLVQFKYMENEGDWSHASSSNVLTTVAGKDITLTPQYPTSILEVSASLVFQETAGTQNSHHTYECALFANGHLEHIQESLGGVNPHGDAHSHSGGRNDRTAPTRRHSHITNITLASGYTHAFIPRSTNAIVLETRVRSTIDADFKVRDLFMIAKEIGVPDDNVSGGSGSINDGV